MASERIVRLERDKVELLDEAAVELVEMVRERLESLNERIEAGEVTLAEASQKIDQLERQLAWLEEAIFSQKRTVRLCEKVTDTIERRFALDGDVLVVLLGRLGGAGMPVQIEGHDELGVRIAVAVTSYDESADVARGRLAAVTPILTHDVH